MYCNISQIPLPVRRMEFGSMPLLPTGNGKGKSRNHSVDFISVSYFNKSNHFSSGRCIMSFSIIMNHAQDILGSKDNEKQSLSQFEFSILMLEYFHLIF